jgi:hypothetical protein
MEIIGDRILSRGNAENFEKNPLFGFITTPKRVQDDLGEVYKMPFL